jgi:hypothetical protein
VFSVFRFFGLRIAKGRYKANIKQSPDAAVVASGTILKQKNKITTPKHKYTIYSASSSVLLGHYVE